MGLHEEIPEATGTSTQSLGQKLGWVVAAVFLVGLAVLVFLAAK
jgi:hypothetical protein